jgi:hypothetical protein
MIIEEEEFLEIFSGIWVNPENKGGFGTWQKVITYHDGITQNYAKLDSDMPIITVKQNISETWRDNEGNVYYRSDWIGYSNVVHYEMGKFSEDGDVYERLVAYTQFEEWEPNKSSYTYFLFYRQE